MGQAIYKKKKTENEIVWEWFLWLFWEKPGVRFIWHKYQPEDEKAIAKDLTYRKPSTFFLWFVGVYLALYGLVSTKYELSLDRVENRLSVIAAQLGNPDTEIFKSLIKQIPSIQAVPTPVKPVIYNPLSFFISLVVSRPNPYILIAN
ncbi:MAG: hypothetical protein GY941_26550 [Planctomycetes bacterium]|nr:hypothetical protein [Planctomycetota bacterium]